jgi:Nif-specific regulatory protein/two-component system response regulator AtoC
MDSRAVKPLNPVSFLQAFITQSIKVAGQRCGSQADTLNYVEHVGLAASHGLEESARTCLGYTGAIDAGRYADLIINLKNRIGGNFSRASGPSGCIRVVNSRCPFGDMVKEAPELCRMTASVFGGIAARNFGYGKVELKKRIALNDSHCEVCVYIDRKAAGDKPGDEYHCEGDKIVSRSASAEVRARVEAKLGQLWCVANDDKTGATRPRPAVVAESQAMRSALEAVEIVAPTRATVLVTGETGVGKEVIARAIHALSDRAERELLAVNCGAIPETLIESALFGHEKGAFTDAYNVHHGFFERADRGTLFLDEIDCLPLPAQARLLRVLQEGDFERVGGRQTLSADVRIIAASNQTLEQLVEDGRFRRDLFYRLNVVPLYIPPLRERTDDLAPLAHHFLRRLAEKYARSPKVLGQPAWSKVLDYSWPGNLRELENVLERAFLFARGPVILDVELPAVPDTVEGSPDAVHSLKTRREEALREAESEVLVQALKRLRGNVSAVARCMDVTPRAVHMRLKRLGINAAAFRINEDSSRH